MNKIIVAVFNTESQAFKGLTAIKSLHDDGLISVYATAVVVKDKEGKVAVKQEASKDPVGAAIGMLTGGLMGVLAGPLAAAGTVAGVAVASSFGALTGAMVGSMYDLDENFMEDDLMNKVTETLVPGKAAVLVEIDETWEAPIDTRLSEMGAEIFRRKLSDVWDDYYIRQSEEYNAEMEELEHEMKEANDDTKASIQKQMDKVKTNLNALNESIEKKIEHHNHVMEAKVKALDEQIGKSKSKYKERLEKRKQKLNKKTKAFKASLEKASENLSNFIDDTI